MKKLKNVAMKNIYKNPKNLLIVLFLFAFTFRVSAVEEEGSFENEFKINKNTAIEFSNKSSDLTIKTWDKQVVILKCTYKIEANDKEDLDLTLEALKSPNVGQSSSLLSIQTNVFSNVHSIVIGGLIKKITATLNTGVVVNLKEHKVDYELYIPDGHQFTLKQKYSDVSMGDYSGETELDLYDVDMEAGKLSNARYLKSKYSKLYFQSLGDCFLDVYDTDIDVGVMGNLDIKSKYSKINIAQVGSVKMDSYDDKLNFLVIESIEGKSKYSDIGFGDVVFANLDIHDCEIRAKNSKKVNLEAKYSGIVFGNVDIFTFPKCYDNEVKADFVGEFSADSKYTVFEFGCLSGMLDMQVYDDKITIGRVDEDFYKLKLVGKYTKASFTLSGTPQYFIDFKAKYTKHQLPDNLVFTNFNNSESSKLELSGRTEDLKKSAQVQVKENEQGVRKANIGNLVIDLYDGTITID